ncbi:MAG: hypothetical protein JWQ79_2870 [Mucilaginibacter sp.]|nr:hypothetical protein [Mucilaginibacter sp.]
MPSAVIASYNYDTSHETLEIRYLRVRFINLTVPEKVFKGMLGTMVRGVWFNRHITGKYPFEEITPGLKQPNYLTGAINNLPCKTWSITY